MAAQRWMFTTEQLMNTPSRKCGIDADKELSYRQQAANLIQDMGQRLQVYPIRCALLADNLLVRFPRIFLVKSKEDRHFAAVFMFTMGEIEIFSAG